MGKNLTQQKRGKGSPTYRAPSFRYAGKVGYLRHGQEVKGKIADVIHCRGHSAPLIKVRYNNDEEILLQAPEGVRVGEDVSAGENSQIKAGNTMQLRNIPEGIPIYNIENSPGDGGRFVRASGAFAKIVAKINNRIIVLLPSGKKKDFIADCRATIGVVAGGGRPEKPFLKAGNKFHAMRAKNKLWPIVSGLSMNAVDHPFGGHSSSSKGRPLQSGRNYPPGRKVGMISPKKTGRKK